MRRRINRSTLALALVFLCVVTAFGQEPKPLAEFSLPTLKGHTVTSQELKDSIVVLDFWATWCERCITEIPAFNRLEREYGPRGVKVIGLAVQSGWAKDIRKFAKRYKMRYTLLVGNDDTVAQFGVISFPATYVIAPGWKLHKKYLGVSETKAADIQRDIETLLKRETQNRAEEYGNETCTQMAFTLCRKHPSFACVRGASRQQTNS